MEVKQNLSEGTGFSYWRPFLADDTMGIDLVGVIFPISFSLVKCLVLKVKGWVLIIKNCCVKITILKKEERKRETWMEELWTKRIGNLSLHKSRNVDTFTFNGLNLVEKRYPKLNVVHVWETSRGRETLVRFVRWNRMDKVEQSYSWLFNYLPPPPFLFKQYQFYHEVVVQSQYWLVLPPKSNRTVLYPEIGSRIFQNYIQPSAIYYSY